MKRKPSNKKRPPRKTRGGKTLPPVVGTMLDIIEEVTFAFGTDAAAEESNERPTLKKLNHHDQL